MKTYKTPVAIFGQDRVSSEHAYTPTGFCAKIDGRWFSVNGNPQEILDVRYAISDFELHKFGLKNDQREE
jgi:hypothetical protein